MPTAKQLADEFAAADAGLNDQMDALVPQFAASNAKFVEDYHNARIIVEPLPCGKNINLSGEEKPPPPLQGGVIFLAITQGRCLHTARLGSRPPTAPTLG